MITPDFFFSFRSFVEANYKFIVSTNYGLVWYDELKEEVDISGFYDYQSIKQLLFLANNITNLTVSPDGRFLFTAATDPENGNRVALLIRVSDGRVTLLPGTPLDLSSVAFAGSISGTVDDAVVYAGQHELYLCSTDGSVLSSLPWTGDNPLSFAAHNGKLYAVFPDALLRIYRKGTEIRSVPLTFNLKNAMVSGRDFRYVFTEDRLYLYCGADLNVIALDGDGTTPIYSAACVLEYLDDNDTLLQFSLEPGYDGFAADLSSEDSIVFHLAFVREYKSDELAARAQEQLDAFKPKQNAG